MLTQPSELSYYCQLILSCYFLSGATPLPADRGSIALSKALPNRRNLVITANANYQAEGAEVVGSVDAALEALNGENAFIIGGASVSKPFCRLQTR